MNILSVHNRYKVRGGEDECRDAEESLLRDKGYVIDVYEENNDKIDSMSRLIAACRTIWSMESYRLMASRLESRAYDLMHVHNFFPLISPSVYYAAKAYGIPVVQSLHNYRLLCANGYFFRDGSVCESCLNYPLPLPSVIHSCYRDNRAATSVVATMLMVHRAMKSWAEKVDIFIALTEFSRSKFIQGGLPAEKIVVKPNFVDPDPGLGEGNGHYALFVGRISPEKGIDTLLDVWRQVGHKMPLKIIGEVPSSSQHHWSSSSIAGVEWLGRQPLNKVYEIMGNASFLIFPSEWYETFGRVAVEAFAKGTPVIASNIGAIAEIVEHERTGLLFTPGNSEELALSVDWALTHPREMAQMRKAARSEFVAKYTAKRNYDMLRNIYERVL